MEQVPLLVPKAYFTPQYFAHSTLELLYISPHTDKSCPKDFFKPGHD